MPFVNIKITNEGVTSEEKTQLIQGATKLLQDVLGKNPKTTVVVIDEVETEKRTAEVDHGLVVGGGQHRVLRFPVVVPAVARPRRDRRTVP